MSYIVFISAEENRKPEYIEVENDFDGTMAFIRRLLNSNNIVCNTHRIGSQICGVFYDEKTIERRNYNLCLEDKEMQLCLVGNMVVVAYCYPEDKMFGGLFSDRAFEVGFAIQQKCSFINGKKVKQYVLEINE